MATRYPKNDDRRFRRQQQGRRTSVSLGDDPDFHTVLQVVRAEEPGAIFQRDIVLSCCSVHPRREDDSLSGSICYHGHMSQPVKLSDALVLDARLAGEAVERSIAGQVEFWARLGRSVELLLGGQQVLTLCRKAAAQPLSAYLESVDSPEGRERVAAYLESQPFPHYQPHPEKPGLLERIDEDGAVPRGDS